LSIKIKRYQIAYQLNAMYSKYGVPYFAAAIAQLVSNWCAKIVANIANK
jgi:hypothetical protein